MNIFIDNRSSAPIYSQIYEQLKNQIINGNLKVDEALPSIRALAKDLRISVITTKRAYEELEKESFIYAKAGRGFFVAPKDTKMLREENLKAIEDHVQKIIPLADSCRLTKKDIVDLIDILWEEKR